MCKNVMIAVLAAALLVQTGFIKPDNLIQAVVIPMVWYFVFVISLTWADCRRMAVRQRKKKAYPHYLREAEKYSYYEGIFPNKGKYVGQDEAFEYAKSHLDEVSQKDKAEFTEWYFSDNWLRREDT